MSADCSAIRLDTVDFSNLIRKAGYTTDVVDELKAGKKRDSRKTMAYTDGEDGSTRFVCCNAQDVLGL